ncbi:MAG: methyltransferase domain-containing protein, partial [Acidimicrobiia bacterium]|nr:methyltransferase domain-containing protein [Acidimicrobiia bacterium]
ELSIEETDVVIDVGCGSGVLSIVAAKLGAEAIYGVDASPDVVEVATGNAEAHGVADRIRFHQGNLFAPLPYDLQADVIIGDVSGIPDTLAAFSGWFPSGTGGGASGSELPVAMLEAARARLEPDGRLYLPTGTLQDEQAILDTARRLFGSVEHLTERVIPLPGQLADSDVVRDLVASGVVTLGRKGSRSTWTARVWLLTSPKQ